MVFHYSENTLGLTFSCLNYRQSNNCLKTLDDDHVDPQIDKDVTKWYGQLYNHDEQCKISIGPDSFFGRVCIGLVFGEWKGIQW